jgi:ribosomal protein S18 acetylase RimI-like enzyme
MLWVARYAVEHGCSRIDWPVKASNVRAISFYESLGAKLVDDRLSYRLSQPSLGALAGGSTGR